ncbi:Carbohydrate esterase 4 protein [Ceratobasidium sp. 428]|nr:Carbohydrate esterase 4 protein [Ceratobasidium sp. 428]
MHAVSRTLIYATAFGAALQGVLGRPTNEQRYAKRAPGVITSCTVPNTAALTFDDGPYKWNREVVDTLNAAGARGTFFVNGNNYDCIYNGNNPENLKYAYDQGHQIASHTWAHQHLPTLSTAEIRNQFTETNDALSNILGVVPAFVRPPYGEYNSAVLSVANSLGQNVVTWDFDSGDSAGKAASASAEAYQELVDSHPSNILTLNHETYSSTVNDLLPEVIKILKAGGYDLVTVAECLRMDAYLSTGAPSKPDGSWTC